MTVDPPYPELKKTHTMARLGRPWRDHKPPPSGPVWAVIGGYGAYWTLVAAIDLGVFDALERLGPSRAEPLADALGVSPPHLEALLDAVVTFGFLEQVGGTYELTETAERYLCTDGAASMAALVRVAPGPLENWSRLADTVRAGVVATPIEADPIAFYGPLVQATFATQHRMASRLGLRLGWARRPGLRVLDLGAGCAPWALAVLAQSPGSTAVVNDWPEILELATARIAEHDAGERIERRPGDFHAIDIEPGAYDVVVLGHLLRTEGEARAVRLLERAFAALRPGGELIVADYFADNERKLNPFGVQMGLTMLANTERGGPLTNEQVATWLRETGFRDIRYLEPIGFNFAYVASTPRGSSA